MIDHVQDAPSNRHRPPLHLACAVQVCCFEGREYLARFDTSFVQPATELIGIVSHRGEFGVTVTSDRPATDHLCDPEMLGAGDVGGQHGQRVGGVVVIPVDGTPVQRLGGQADNQLAGLPTKVFDHLQVMLQFRCHRCQSHQSRQQSLPSCSHGSNSSGSPSANCHTASRTLREGNTIGTRTPSMVIRSSSLCGIT